ncbi:hypothetical protein TTHERM_00211530 (macronuclear) [Tetrahymena thermophila SB210]|uniref:Transmembrane protein n=1 Tax=Tetrahymena thermophila (strain SB210) TaxID=312017 RepID=Q22N84_TETTS|nr:hypothetical protein TTHERM_00211530 [Tetrahymena thermophila SB210]EAR86901.2 hypothetical protein TTHERM_00211530 [Tetrahymena thermophila SB210]|eukprot:XP_001007146.2 hypothetical protein TTHERM_00211530 [Tetrahymena thermophila SB210]
MKIQQIFLLYLFCTCCSVYALSQCKCTIDSSPFPGSVSSVPTALALSPEDEYSEMKNIGKLIAVGSIQILQQTFQVQQKSNINLQHNCPAGYTPVTQDDLKAIIARPDYSTLIGSDYLKLDFSNNTYYSQTKVYPSSTKGSDSKSFKYYTLSVDSKGKPNINYESTYFDTKTKLTICKRNLQQFPVQLAGYEGYDLEKGKSYQFQIINKNVQAYYVSDSNNNTYTTSTFTYTHNGNSQWGCATINFKLQVFGGVTVGDCLTIWTKNQIAFNADSSSFNINTIQGTVLSGVKANMTEDLFFSHGSAPIAPIIGDSSSFYVYYSNLNSSQLMVQKVSSQGTPLGSAIDTKQVGYPFDIVTTDFGFVVMAGDSNQRAFIQAINKDGSQRWLRILVDNGINAVSPLDQIKFYQSDKCDLPSGMTLMYDPENGRLNYARGKIQAIWAHYNHFGYYSNGERDDHTGDTMISLDADTGLDQNIFWAWGASHSLYQNLHYDGKNLYVASLGDAYPMNIKFNICNIDTYQCVSSTNLVQGDIPGDGSGNSAGRQGSFIDIVGNRNQKLFIYSRKDCTGGYDDISSENSINELAVIKFDSQLKYISTTTLISGDDAARINNIKTVPYGKNILLAYTMIPSSDVQNFNRQNIIPTEEQTYVALLSGVDGSILVQPAQLQNYQISASDDWRVLENGSIAYTYVDSDYNLNIYLTPALTTPSYPNLIVTTDPIYGFDKFTNQKATVPLNNYNNKCVTDQNNFNWVSIKSTSKNINSIDIGNQNQDANIHSNETSSKTIKSLCLTLLIIVLCA